MCSRRLHDYLKREEGDVKRIFASAGRLGQGTYGVVYKVRHGSGASTFAKEREVERQAQQERWAREQRQRQQRQQLHPTADPARPSSAPFPHLQQQQQQSPAPHSVSPTHMAAGGGGVGTDRSGGGSATPSAPSLPKFDLPPQHQEPRSVSVNDTAAPASTAPAQLHPHASASSSVPVSSTAAAHTEEPAASRHSGLPPISHPPFSMHLMRGTGRNPRRMKHVIPYGSCPRYDETDQDPNRWYALKAMQAPTAKNLDVSVPALREFTLLRELKHTNIIMIKDVFLRPTVDPKQIWLLFEYAAYDLWYLLQSHRREQKCPLPEPMQQSIMYQLCCGMEYLHAHWIIHRDLKPGNILITSFSDPRPGVVKLADFGLARLCSAPPKPLASVDPIVVTYWYRAPELLLGTKHYTRAIDMWALGCIMAELVNLRPLFHVPEDQPCKDPYFFKQLKAIAQVLGVAKEMEWDTLMYMPEYRRYRSDFQSFPQRSSILHERVNHKNTQFLGLLRHLLTYDPKKRATAAAALQHPYFKTGRILDNVWECDIPRYPSRQLTRDSQPHASIIRWEAEVIPDDQKHRLPPNAFKTVASSTASSTLNAYAPHAAKRSKR